MPRPKLFKNRQKRRKFRLRIPRDHKLHDVGRTIVDVAGMALGAKYGGLKGAKIAKLTVDALQAKRQLKKDQKPMDNILGKIGTVPTVINAIFDGKKTYIFTTVVSILAIFQPELLADLIYSVNVVGSEVGAAGAVAPASIDPQMGGFIAFLMQATNLLRGWKKLFGDKEETIVINELGD